MRPGPEFLARYPTAKVGLTLQELLVSRFRRDEPSQWSTDKLHLVLKETGFLTGSFSTQLAKNVRLALRTIAGLMEAGHYD